MFFVVFSGGFALFLVVDFVEMDDLRENNPHGKVNQTECGDVSFLLACTQIGAQKFCALEFNSYLCTENQNNKKI